MQKISSHRPSWIRTNRHGAACKADAAGNLVGQFEHLLLPTFRPPPWDPPDRRRHERKRQGAAKKDEKPIQQSPAKVKETSGRESRRVHPSGPVGTLKHLRKIALGCIRYWQSLQVAHDSASCNCTLNKEKSRY
jgi:hypothetical protein